MDQQAQLEQAFELSQIPDSAPSNIPQLGVPVQVIEVQGEVDSGPLEMDEAEIQSILTQYIRNATNWVGSEIAIQQAKAMKYYLGLPEDDLAPPGIQGRSTIVDTTVSDQIEWMMPALMDIFFASGNIIDYTARKQSDAAAARQMSSLVNYIVCEDNNGFQIFMDWFKNALLNKVGVAKVYWQEDNTVVHEHYDNQTDAELAILEQDPEIEIVKIVSYVEPMAERAAMEQQQQAQDMFDQWNQAAAQAKQRGLPWPPMQPPQPGSMPPPQPGAQGQPPQAPQPQPMQPPPKPQPIDPTKLPQLHNVVARRSQKSGKVTFAAMNPEDFLIDERSRRIEDGFCAHRVMKTLSDLKAEGYQNLDRISIDDIESQQDAVAVEMSEVPLARESMQAVFKPAQLDDYGDESQRKVWLYECYVPMDCDGDGIAEWRKIVIAGNAILLNEICEGPPFAALCPIPIPGLFYGRSLADMAMPIMFAKTGVLRSLVDNMNVQVNGRTWAVEGQVNINDLLTNRPGGVVRVKSMNAVGMLQQGMADSQGAYALLQYLDTNAQERSGITKYSQGLDADTLNHTATGIENITQRADLRVKLIARTFAETGVKDLCRLIQRELIKHQDKNMAFELDGNWVDIDPRVWKNQYSMRANVGLGTGDRTRMVNQTLQLLTVQQQAFQAGLVTPANLYQSFTDLVNAMQKGNPSAYFTLPDPSAPKPPPPPDPQTVLVQGQLQLQKEKQDGEMQLEALKAQAAQANDERDAQHKMEQIVLKEKLLDQRQRDQFTTQQAWEREKFYAQLAANTNAAAMKNQVDGATAAANNNVIVRDLNNQQEVQIPIEHALTIRQQNIESAHADADRVHQAQQNELDRQAQAEQAAQAAAQQSQQVQSPS